MYVLRSDVLLANLIKKIKCAVENDDNVKELMSFKYLGRTSTVIVIVFINKTSERNTYFFFNFLEFLLHKSQRVRYR
jgi:hypothetical protein